MHGIIRRLQGRLPLAALVAIATVAAAAPPPAPAPATSAAALARAKLAAVRKEIADIAATQRATAASRSAIDARLAQESTQLDQAANAVRDADAAIAAQSARLDELERQRSERDDRIAAQRAALAAVLRAAYTLERGSDLALLLGEGDLARTDRALAYSRYFQRDRVARIRTLLADAAQLDLLQRDVAAATAALRQQRAARAEQVGTLDAARAAQRKLLAEADASLAQGKDRLVALQRDAAALDALLKRLQNVFADIPAHLGDNPPFAQLRGKLAWPVAGARRTGTGALAHGVTIAAPPGTGVRAVAYGRVAWSDFMRGFGMLVIIDHGDGWMSLYGGNEAVRVSAGDWVGRGQVIATVAAGATQGAWFGLRHDGKPVDPAGWFAPPR